MNSCESLATHSPSTSLDLLLKISFFFILFFIKTNLITPQTCYELGGTSIIYNRGWGKKELRLKRKKGVCRPYIFEGIRGYFEIISEETEWKSWTFENQIMRSFE